MCVAVVIMCVFIFVCVRVCVWCVYVCALALARACVSACACAFFSSTTQYVRAHVCIRVHFVVVVCLFVCFRGWREGMICRVNCCVFHPPTPFRHNRSL